MKNRRIYEICRTLFLCLAAVYTAVREVPPLNVLIDSTAVSVGVMGLGLILFVWGVLLDGSPLRDRKADLLVVFMLVTLVSCFVNRRYGIADNLKALGAMFLFFFVFFPVGVGDTKERRRKETKCVFGSLSVVWNVLSLVSIGMYFFSVEYEIVKTHGLGAEAAATGNDLYLSTSAQGFSLTENRLWGIFQDPNYASFVSVAVIVAAVYFILSSKKIVTRVLSVISILIQFTYLTLGGSRSGLIALLLAAAFATMYLVMSRVTKLGKSDGEAKPAVRALAGALAAVIVCGALFALQYASKTALPYAKAAVQKTTSAAAAQKIAAGYDALYAFGRVTVKSRNGVAVPDTPDNPDEPTSEPTTDMDEPTTDVDEPVTEPVQPKPIERADTNKGDVTNGRLIRWMDALKIFKTTPVLGTSPRNIFSYARQKSDATRDTVMAKFKIYSHNGYIDVLVCTGIAGAAVMFLFLLLCAVKVVRRFIRREGDLEFMLAGAVFLGFAVSAVFVSDLFFMISIGSFLFWTAAGGAVHAENEENNGGVCYKIAELVLRPLRKAQAKKGEKTAPQESEA